MNDDMRTEDGTPLWWMVVRLVVGTVVVLAAYLVALGSLR
jgi:hypothetical protein